MKIGKKLRVGVLASGSGTDLQSIIDASEECWINAEVVCVISDREDAFALQRAKNYTINAYFVNPKGKDTIDFDRGIDRILEKNNVELVVGAGYMRVLSSCFVKKWYGKLINIHPALLPSFKGINGQKDAIDYGVKITGCTTHFIDEDIDHGPIILQAAVKSMQEDNRDILAKRILEVEHQILPRTIDLFEQGRLEIVGRKVIIKKGDTWIKKFKLYKDVLYSEGY
jgi:phosphoribosylglycinamide formyltransferase-1